MASTAVEMHGWWGPKGHFCWLMVARDMVDGCMLMCCPLTPLFSNHYPHFFLMIQRISFGKGVQKMEVSKNKVHAPPLPRQTYDYALGSCNSRKKWVRGPRWMFRIYVDRGGFLSRIWSEENVINLLDLMRKDAVKPNSSCYRTILHSNLAE